MPNLEPLLAPPFLFLLVGLVGLCVGSFLNVVAHRLPIMLERDWRGQCREILGLEGSLDEPAAAFNLMSPASRCPHCGHGIRWWENIPLLSYMILRGRCSGCSKPISLRYPLVEAVTALLSLIVVWQLGPTPQAAALLPLTWALIALTLIDLDQQLLPDSITLPFLWLGLLLGLPAVFIDAGQAILGAAVGYLSLWGFYWLFKLITGKEGMGYGDFKLLALFGAWAGWQKVFLALILSSLVGALIGIALILLMGHDKRKPIPFGPYLAIAGWISLLWGDGIVRSYLAFSGLG
ncbi:MAG: A24 family peptidase [Gammaproteobacteria bacterium]|nr:A24 family peptidase [Gammaproteobacteria bacterium]MBU1654042.1 A24 family peptidase [Gammaproteobacteria bacterium]MBU1961748.1 A24 family peptidase [Gammaproteobacteria bacterium]